MTSFEEFKSEALRKCCSKEDTKRVLAEIKLFSARGWEKYVLLLVNTIDDLQMCDFDFPYEMVGSSLDSFAIWLLTSDSRNGGRFPGSKRKRGILFNDALRLSVCIHKMFAKEHPEFAHELNSCLEKNFRELGLVYSEHFVKGSNPLPMGSPETDDDLIIVSKDKIPESDEEYIMTETREVREGEAEILHKYLILRVVLFGGI